MDELPGAFVISKTFSSHVINECMPVVYESVKARLGPC